MRVEPTTAAIKNCLPRPSASGRLGYACNDNEQRKSTEQDQCVTFPDASGLKKMMAQVSPPEDMAIGKGEGSHGRIS
jgi:hypothetical protein